MHESRPARGAWVEIAVLKHSAVSAPVSRPARGAWVEILRYQNRRSRARSRPARGAWVEIAIVNLLSTMLNVAPREGRVG